MSELLPSPLAPPRTENLFPSGSGGEVPTGARDVNAAAGALRS